MRRAWFGAQPSWRSLLVLLFFLLSLLLLFASPLPVQGALNVYTLASGQSVLPGPGFTAQSITADSLRVAGVDVVAELQEMLQQAQQLQADSGTLTARVGAVQAQLGTMQSEAAIQSTRVAALFTPTQVQATPGSGQAEVQWSLASTTVTATPGGHTCVASGLDGERACTVTGLTNGQAYTFTARRTNSLETGPLSPPSNPATPALICRALVVATAGDGGAVSVSPTNSAGCPSGEYTPGTVVTVTATPEPGFGGTWSGGETDSSSGEPPQLSYTITVGETISAPPIVASFAPCYALVVNVAGSAGSSSAEILSPANSPGCAAGNFVEGSTVFIKATEGPTWFFIGWSGTNPAGPGNGVLAFIMPAASATQSAMFSQCLPLSLVADPADESGGTVSVSPSSSVGCPTNAFFSDEYLTIAANPKAGFTTAQWTGPLGVQDGTGSASFKMPTAAIAVKVAFRRCYQLTVGSGGSGGGTVIIIGSTHSLACSNHYFIAGAVITVLASPTFGYALRDWTGADGSDEMLEFTMPEGTTTLTANFVPCYKLTLSPVTGGTAVGTPANSPGCAPGLYRGNAAISFVATPDAGYIFSSWSGAAATSAQMIFTMPNGAVNLAPVFTRCYVLNVTAGAGGVATQSPMQSGGCPVGSYLFGEFVTVAATSNSGYEFVEWLGDFTGTMASFGLSMNEPYSLLATFTPCLTLTRQFPVGSNVVATPPNSPNCPLNKYISGTSISVKATPATGWVFLTWLGNVGGTSNPVTFNMPLLPPTIIAQFRQCFALTVSYPPDEDFYPMPQQSPGCPPITYFSGTSIKLNAVSNLNSFRRWSGALNSTDNPATLTMPEGGASLTAIYVTCVHVNTSSIGSGSVAIANSWRSECTTNFYPNGAPLSATATPANGFVFLYWNGTFNGNTSNPLNFTLPSSAVSLVANFAPCYALNVIVGSDGTVTRSSAQSAGCAPSSYVAGTVVTLTAKPDSGFTLALPSDFNPNPLQVTMSAPVSLKVNFSACLRLTLNYPAGQSLVATPSNSTGCANGYFVSGTQISVRAFAAVGWSFKQWTNGFFGTVNPLEFPMPSTATSVTADFVACIFVNVTVSGSGTISTGSSTPSSGCNGGGYPVGATVTVTASPGSGNTFLYWTGNSSNTTTTISFVLTAGTVQLVAHFAPCYPVTLVVSPPSAGSIILSAPQSLSCAPGTYISGQNLQISIAPASNEFVFTGFNGSIAGSSNPRFFPVPVGGASIQANFKQCFRLTMTQDDGGVANTPVPTSSGGCDPGYYFASASVSVSASPSAFFAFEQWTDASTSTSSSFNFVMPAAAATLRATFHAQLYGQPDYFSNTTDNPSSVLGFDHPTGLAFDSKKTLYVSDSINHRVLVFPQGSRTPAYAIGQADLSGTDINRGLGLSFPNSNSLYQPACLAVDASDGLYVADYYNHRVLYFLFGATSASRVYGQDGSFTTRDAPAIPSATSLNTPAAVALDAAGNVYISDMNNNRVLFFTGASTTPSRVYGQMGSYTTKLNTPITDQSLKQPAGMALDAGGNLYVADWFNHRVLFFQSGSTTASRVYGQVSFVTAAANMASTTSAATLNYPYSVALGPDGTLYVSDRTNNRVLAYPSSGSTGATRVWGQLSMATNVENRGGATSPTSLFAQGGLSFDRTGHLFVADQGNNRVLELTL